jgi:hypothetical protein
VSSMLRWLDFSAHYRQPECYLVVHSWRVLMHLVAI